MRKGMGGEEAIERREGRKEYGGEKKKSLKTV